MSIETSLERAKESYKKLESVEKIEVTRLVTGTSRPERVILNPKRKKRRRNG